MITGASIYGAALNPNENEKINNLSLLDITPYTFGIEVVGGVIEVFILKNRVIPIMETKSLTTYNDNQSYVIIRVFEGERLLTKDNKLLDILYLNGLPPSKKGELEIDITFYLDSNLNLIVTANEKVTNKKIETNINFQNNNLMKDKFKNDVNVREIILMKVQI